MKTITESIFKVTFQNPWNHALGLDKFVKSRDKEHATRIGANMGYGLVSRVEFACDDVIEEPKVKRMYGRDNHSL